MKYFKILLALLTLVCITSCRNKVESKSVNLGKIECLLIETTYVKVDSILLKKPLILKPEYITRVDSLGLDSTQKVKFRKVTKIVNGGLNGWDDRLKEWIRIKKILEKSKK